MSSTNFCSSSFLSKEQVINQFSCAISDTRHWGLQIFFYTVKTGVVPLASVILCLLVDSHTMNHQHTHVNYSASSPGHSHIFIAAVFVLRAMCFLSIIEDGEEKHLVDELASRRGDKKKSLELSRSSVPPDP